MYPALEIDLRHRCVWAARELSRSAFGSAFRPSRAARTRAPTCARRRPKRD